MSVRELRYKPGRRWVGRVDVDGLPWAVAKAVRRPALSTRRPRCGRPPGPVRPSCRCSRWTAGTRCSCRAGSRARRSTPVTAGPWLAEVGAALAGLHRTPAPPAFPVADPVAAGLDALRAVRTVLPAAAPLAQRCLGLALAALADPPRRRVLAHGDLNVEQVVLGASGPVLLDLDRAQVDEPLADVASWVAHARAAAPDLDAGTAAAQAEQLLDGYAGPAGTSATLAAARAVALALLQRSVEPFRYRRAGWPERRPRGVRAALREVDRP